MFNDGVGRPTKLDYSLGSNTHAATQMCVDAAASGLRINTSDREAIGMENSMFENLSPIEVCRKMAAICQKSADETSPGAERERLQIASDKFMHEAKCLAMSDSR